MFAPRTASCSASWRLPRGSGARAAFLTPFFIPTVRTQPRPSSCLACGRRGEAPQRELERGRVGVVAPPLHQARGHAGRGDRDRGFHPGAGIEAFAGDQVERASAGVRRIRLDRPTGLLADEGAPARRQQRVGLSTFSLVQGRLSQCLLGHLDLIFVEGHEVGRRAASRSQPPAIQRLVHVRHNRAAEHEPQPAIPILGRLAGLVPASGTEHQRATHGRPEDRAGTEQGQSLVVLGVGVDRPERRDHLVALLDQRVAGEDVDVRPGGEDRRDRLDAPRQVGIVDVQLNHVLSARRARRGIESRTGPAVLLAHDLDGVSQRSKASIDVIG